MVGMSYCLPDGTTGYLPFAHKGGGNLDDGVFDRWAKVELRDIHINFFNAPYDLHNFYEAGLDLEAQGCTVSDVGLSAALLDDHRRRSRLEDIAQDYLKEGKIPGLDPARIAEYHAGDVEVYARQDSLIVHKLKKHFKPLLEEQGLTRVQKIEDDCIFATCEMERNGYPVDEEKLDLWLKQSERDYVQCLLELHKVCGFRVNPKSNPDLNRVFEKFDIPLPRYDELGDKRRFGKVCFEKRYIESIDHPAVRLIRRAKRLAGVRSKYLIPYSECFKKFGKFIYSLHQLRVDNNDEGEVGTVSGRYSSSAYGKTRDGVNAQQVAGKKHQHSTKEEVDWPYKPKELFIAENGQLVLSGDADQIEYRVFTHFGKPAAVLAEYERDPHTNFHKIIHKMILDFREITYELTKDCNFAGLFGAGPNKFAWMLKMNNPWPDGRATPAAKKLYNLYHNTLPEAKSLHKEAMRVAEERGYVKTLLGRRARFPDKMFVNAAINRVVQGTAADEMKLKLIELRKERKYTGFKLRLTVHDEVCGDVPDKEAAMRVSEVLNRQLLPTRVPLLWTVGIGPNWNDAKKVA